MPSSEKKNKTNRDEYIHSLETALKLLQEEMNGLKSRINQNAVADTSDVQTLNPDVTGVLAIQLSKCRNLAEVQNLLYEYYLNNFNGLEVNIFYHKNGILSPLTEESNTSITINKLVKSLEEEGIIDWALSQENTSLIPNLREEPGIQQTFLAFTPLKIRGRCIGLIAAKLGMDVPERTVRQVVDMIGIYVAMTIESIILRIEHEDIRKKLQERNYENTVTSINSSVGMLAGPVSAETVSLLNVIKTNIKLLESGLGDPKRRLEIIEDQIDTVSEVNKRLALLTEPVGLEEDKPANNVEDIIRDVVLFAGYQLQKEGIRIDFEPIDKELVINGSKPAIEHALVSLVLFSVTTMPDEGLVRISALKHKEKNVLISISDNGTGINEELLGGLFTLADNGLKTSTRVNLKISKDIINRLGGDISIASDTGKGTTYKIVLPLVSNNPDVIER